MSWYWPRFLIEGDAMFESMLQNYDTMLKGEKFDIIDIRYRFSNEIDDIKEKYQEEICKLLFPWIQQEHCENRLFDKSNWKPFRDLEAMSDAVFGYKKMFQFKHYYFQLCLTTEFFMVDGKFHDNDMAHFVLALYGWLEEGKEKLQPDNCRVIPQDCIMPQWYWDIK
jgi:hypothetical protein